MRSRHTVVRCAGAVAEAGGEEVSSAQIEAAIVFGAMILMLVFIWGAFEGWE